MRRATLTAALMAAALYGSAASAQTPVKPQPPDPNMPAPHNTVPEKIEPEAPAATGSTRPSLSHRLRQSEGVIHPPASGDTEIVKPTPDVGTMPVIPPPGEPGGNPRIQPK